MPGTEIAIGVRGLSKSYTIEHQHERSATLSEQILKRARRGFRRSEKETFWALQDISFDIHQGDVVGIVGRNGAGKSTLLKILSRITEPTAGEVDLYGSVGSLLEVGTGFHPELTGRENVFLNGAILGMNRREIARQFDAIVDFAGIAQFLDTPVKRYSSGMYVRLAFAVAAHLNTDILLVDEVLAVGDTEFQKKCLGKIKDVAHSGRTVIFVSHHMQSVSVLCTKAMYLEKGRLIYSGDVPAAIDHYVRSFERPATALVHSERRPGTGEWRLTSVEPAREYFESGGEKTIRFTAERRKPFIGKFFASCVIINELGFTILHCDSRMTGHWIEAEDRYEGEFTLRTPWLRPGDYRVDMYLCNAGVLDACEHACRLHVLPLLPYPVPDNPEATSQGVVFADFSYSEIPTPQKAARSASAELAAL